MKNETLLIELHYLPCIQYFVYLFSYRKIFIDLKDRYTKQTYRNRCRINGANNIEDLIIPIRKIHSRPMMTREVQIDSNQKWLNKHLRAIQSAYGKAPFYEYYVDEIFGIFKKTPHSLVSLNQELLTKCLEILEFDNDLEFIDELQRDNENDVRDARNEINPKKSIGENSIFLPQKYFQIFGNNFVQNLSIIDLIFCEGPQARQILKKSCRLNRQI